MSETYQDLAASEVAAWLERQDQRFWTVDGEDRISSAINLPCMGDELAFVLRKFGGTLRVFDRSEPSNLHDGTVLEDFAAREEDGGIVLELAWLAQGDEVGDRWILAEDRLAEGAFAEAQRIA